MADKIRKKKKETDFAITAFRVVQEATKETEPGQPQPTTEGKNPAAVALGRLGGLKGGKARASKMTPEQRKEIAQKAAKARWDDYTKPPSLERPKTKRRKES
jgi:hypothetical protein